MSACPSDEAWAAFPKAVGAVEHQALVQHLAACSPCRTIVAELARQGAIAFSDTVDPSLPAGRDPVTTNRLGRFIVLDVLGEGGMGTVLSAYDPRLDRRVALKVLRGATARSPAGHARLLREAQALARIAHPHVVPIHEVAELDGEVVLVMEHVPGQTLQEWVRAGSPPWREIVRAYIQAGRGLAAVHAAGFVHRDFKPSNALIGADARVRVIDFGLVREELTTTAGDEPPPIGGTPAIDGADGSDRLTRTGTVLGTPAYMAPEQFERADVGPRTDVYGFCISLTEALYGIRPFTGRRPGFAEGEGDDPPTATSVPRAVWIALRKGLSARPEDRPATIDTVLDELSALVEPSRRRWIVAAVVSTSLAGVAIGWFALPSAVPQEEPCSGGAAQLAPIWSDSIAGAVTSQLIASGSAYGEQVAPRVVATLTSYANAWTAAHRAACMSHRRGEQSAALLDRQMYCLDRHRQALSSTVDLLVHADAPGDPVRLVLGLPSLQRCTNRDELAATSPADGSQHGQSHALEGALERAAALERNGDYAGASEVAARIVRDAEPLAIEQLDAAANLQLGRARLLAGDLAQAEQPLRAALRHAIAADAPAIAVEAIARRIYAAGMTGGLDQTRLAELRALAEDFLQRTHDGGFAHALLLNNVGVIHRSLGQREAARDVLRQALDARGAVARPEMEMSVIVENLAAVTDDPVERAALYARAVREAETTLGGQHPETLRSRLVQAAATLSPLDRRDQLAHVCTAWARFHPSAVLDRALCEQTLGDAEQELGHRDGGSARFTQAAALYAGAQQPLLSAIARAHAEQLADRQESARAAITAARGYFEPAAAHPWEIALRAEVDALAADLAARAGNHHEAVRVADAAIAALSSIDLSAQLQWQTIAARARVTAARSRLALGGPRRREQARGLLELAQRWYQSAGAGYEARVDQLAELIAASPVR